VPLCLALNPPPPLGPCNRTIYGPTEVLGWAGCLVVSEVPLYTLHVILWEVNSDVILPLSSELGTNTPVKARFWTCPEQFSVHESSLKDHVRCPLPARQQCGEAVLSGLGRGIAELDADLARTSTAHTD
jgi:hypothetical protein